MFCPGRRPFTASTLHHSNRIRATSISPRWRLKLFMPQEGFHRRELSVGYAAAMADFNILTPNAMLGYGFKTEHFWYGIEKYQPKAIIVDSGSTDAGPYKLGMNKMTCGRDSYIRDLTPMLQAVHYRRTKLLIGSVGGDGSNKHVQETLSMVEEISEKYGFQFKIATIDAGIDRSLIKQRIKDGKVGPCGPVEPLTEDAVDRAVDVVAQMGAEP
jgi:hypothetical protein